MVRIGDDFTTSKPTRTPNPQQSQVKISDENLKAMGLILEKLKQSDKTSATSKIKAVPFPTSTTSTVQINKDGTYTETETIKDGSGVKTKRTIVEYDQDGNRIIKSVTKEVDEFYGGKKKTEYVDKDGDGFADYIVETGIDGKQKKTKLPNIKGASSQEMNNRNMEVLNGGNKGLVYGA